MAQQLLKIIIQKMPIDKNGDLVFDVDEAQQLHNNAVRMLSRAVGIDVLTTFADVDVANMQGTYNTSAKDDLEKVERRVFNETGSSEMLFNTDGNIALDKSILNDEAALYNLIQQFEAFLNKLLTPFNKNPKKLYYRVQILPTTIYNYKEVSKLYKEQTQLGYSKMLPQIALGQSQSDILHTAHFENTVLLLVREFIPPLNTNVLNAEVINGLMGKEVLSEGNSKNSNNNSGGNGNNNNSQKSGEGAGRPTKESQGEAVSEKTMQNRESAH